MQTRTVEASGAIVFWTVNRTFRLKLIEGMDSLGMADLVPGQPTDRAALRSAMGAYADSLTKKEKGEVEHVVTPHVNSSENGFEVCKVEKDTTRNDYEGVFSAKVVETTSLNGHKAKRVEVTRGWADEDALTKLFEHKKHEVSGAAVGGMLVAVVKKLGAVTLRDSGGVYWIPEEMISSYEAVARVVEGAAAETTKVYLSRTAMDEGTLRAVRDSIVKEIADSATAIAKEIPEAGDRRLETLSKEANNLHNRIVRFEEILGSAAVSLMDVVDSVKQSLVTASMQTIDV